jgi:DNA-binding transcriptional regulator YhcF (GntR family)
MTVMPISSPRRRRAEIVDVMRRRVLGGVGAGALRRGDRLPSARELAAEFDVDPRLVLAAYRVLSTEGLVDIRRRSGIYVAATPEVAGGPPVVAEGWLVDVLYQGIEHGIMAPRLGEWLRRCMTSRRLRAAVVAGTADHIEGISGELREDYGVDTIPFSAEVLEPPMRTPNELAAADFAVTPEQYVDALRRVLRPLGKRVIGAPIRTELDPELRLALARDTVHALVVDPRSAAIVRATAGEYASRVQVHVVGQDDLRSISDGAALYVTRSARQRLGAARLPGRVLPPTRLLAPSVGREVLALIVEANLKAMRG